MPDDVVGIGTDLVEIGRLARALERTPRLRERIFSAAEIAYCEPKARPAQHYAVRFAAKEAFLKALGVGIFGGVALAEIEVVREGKGPPAFQLGPTALARLKARGGDRAMLSLSHGGDAAVAFVLIAGAARRPRGCR
jgi:holo-[acyl-carrier protein] synthase